ncbi:MAG: hypothetical protein ACE5PT_13950, partial [Gemmatimonadales bacterium]
PAPLFPSPAGGTPRGESGFRMLMERDAQDQRGEDYFVRQGITSENPKARRPRGVRWILVVSDPALSTFLGDAENPAHAEWQPTFRTNESAFSRFFPSRNSQNIKGLAHS